MFFKENIVLFYKSLMERRKKRRERKKKKRGRKKRKRKEENHTLLGKKSNFLNEFATNNPKTNIWSIKILMD